MSPRSHIKVLIEMITGEIACKIVAKLVLLFEL